MTRTELKFWIIKLMVRYIFVVIVYWLSLGLISNIMTTVFLINFPIFTWASFIGVAYLTYTTFNKIIDKVRDYQINKDLDEDYTDIDF